MYFFSRTVEPPAIIYRITHHHIISLSVSPLIFVAIVTPFVWSTKLFEHFRLLFGYHQQFFRFILQIMPHKPIHPSHLMDFINSFHAVHYSFLFNFY